MMAATYGVCSQCESLNKVDLQRGTPQCGRCGTELVFHGAVQEVGAGGLTRLMSKSPLPVVVDFWAPWCGPCRSFAPTFEETADRFAGRAVFVKLNTDEHPSMSAQIGIRGIPTLAVFLRDKELARQSGAMMGPAFGQWLEPLLRS